MNDPGAAAFGVRDYLHIEIVGREFPKVRCGDDAGWLVVDVTGGDRGSRIRFRGPYLHIAELRLLLQQAETMLKTGAGVAQLETVEPLIELGFEFRGKLGHIEMTMDVNLLPEVSGVERSRHHYQFEIDQTDLQILCKDLRAALKDIFR